MDTGKVIESFHLMWDNFPERARLIRKDRTVLAVNKFAASIGMEPGVRCIDAGPREAHAGCLANKALQQGCGMYLCGGARVPFWVPVEGAEDLYVHFSLPADMLNKKD